jgi:hypothetical protein
MWQTAVLLGPLCVSSDLIGKRTRDLPACSIVPQPTTLPHVLCIKCWLALLLFAISRVCITQIYKTHLLCFRIKMFVWHWTDLEKITSLFTKLFKCAPSKAFSGFRERNLMYVFCSRGIHRVECWRFSDVSTRIWVSLFRVSVTGGVILKPFTVLYKDFSARLRYTNLEDVNGDICRNVGIPSTF